LAYRSFVLRLREATILRLVLQERKGALDAFHAA
jgi:hypothetical protein